MNISDKAYSAYYRNIRHFITNNVTNKISEIKKETKEFPNNPRPWIKKKQNECTQLQASRLTYRPFVQKNFPFVKHRTHPPTQSHTSLIQLSRRPGKLIIFRVTYSHTHAYTQAPKSTTDCSSSHTSSQTLTAARNRRTKNPVGIYASPEELMHEPWGNTLRS